MSTEDIRIQNRCDHRLLFERVDLGTDLVSLSPAYPVSAKQTFELLRFGTPVPASKYTFVSSSVANPFGKYQTIELRAPDKYPNPLYEVSYNVPLEFCPKCASTQFVDDMDIDDRQQVRKVSGATALIQSVEKTIVTTKGTNKYYPWVGTQLKGLVGTKVTDFSMLSQEIKTRVGTALENLKAKQLKHQEVNPQVSSDEVLGLVEKIEVSQPEEDPSIIEIYVQYTSQSGRSYDYTQLMDLTQFRPR